MGSGAGHDRDQDVGPFSVAVERGKGSEETSHGVERVAGSGIDFFGSGTLSSGLGSRHTARPFPLKPLWVLRPIIPSSQEVSRLMLLRLIILSLCLAAAFEQTHAEPTYELIFQGGRLSSAQAKVIQEKLSKRPDDLESRTRLCAYYFFASQKNKELRPALRSHILWFIENEPRAELLSEFVARLTPELDPEAYADARKLWTKQLEAFPKDTEVQSNAAKWFLYSDRRLAESILLKIESDRPRYTDWPERLAELYLLDVEATTGEERRSYARKAMEAHQRVYNLMPEYARTHLHKPIGDAALLCGEIELARRSAEELLKERPPRKPRASEIHEGNILLGQIALTEGNVAAAKTHLSLAAKLKITEEDGWLEPDHKLAADLLEKGERDAVLTYLKDCRVFWKEGRKRTDRWSKLIREGGTPMWEPFEEEPGDDAGGPTRM